MSGDARAAVADRITAFRATGNAGVLLDDRALIEVAAIRDELGWPPSGPVPPEADIRRGLDAAVTAGTFLWLRAQVLPPADRLDDLMEATELLTAAREVAPRSVPRPVARSLAVITGRARHFDPASAHDQAIDVLSAGAGELSAIDHAIMLLAAAARFAAGDRYQPYYLSDLGTAWLDRFAITGRPRDLENSVTSHERALAVPVPVTEDQAGLLANYSAALLAQFERGGPREQLDHALVTARMATDLARSAAEPRAATVPGEAGPGEAGSGEAGAGPGEAGSGEAGAGPGEAGSGPAASGRAGPGPAVPGPASERATAVRLAQLSSLSRLRAALLASYEQGGGEVDLDEAVQVAQEAASLAPAGDPAHPRYQASLAYLLSLQAARRATPDPAASPADAAQPAGTPPPGAVPPAPPDEPWRRMLTAG
jgi:hypothetical protein